MAPSNPPPQTIKSLKQDFLHAQTRLLSQPPAPSRAWRRAHDDNNNNKNNEDHATPQKLSEKAIDDALFRLNQTLLQHAKRVYPPQATRHVAEQIEQLYLDAGEERMQAEREDGEGEAGAGDDVADWRFGSLGGGGGNAWRMQGADYGLSLTPCLLSSFSFFLAMKKRMTLMAVSGWLLMHSSRHNHPIHDPWEEPEPFQEGLTRTPHPCARNPRLTSYSADSGQSNTDISLTTAQPEIISALPSTWDSPREAATNPLEAKRYADLVVRLQGLSTRHSEAEARVLRLRQMKAVLEPFSSSSSSNIHPTSSNEQQQIYDNEDGKLIQQNLITRDGQVEKELERMRMLLARVGDKVARLHGKEGVRTGGMEEVGEDAMVVDDVEVDERRKVDNLLSGLT